MSTQKPLWQQSSRAGLLAGLTVAYLALVGMIAAFSERSIIYGVITLGQLLIFAPALVAGYLVVRRGEDGSRAGRRLTLGLLAGLFASLPPLLLIAIGSTFDVRFMFVNLTPQLIAMLTFDLPILAGSGLLMFSFAALGIAGAATSFLPNRLRHAIFSAALWVLGVGLLSELIIQMIRPFFGNDAVRLLFQRGAPRPITSLVVFVMAAILSYLFSVGRPRIQQKYATLDAGEKQWVQRSGFGLLGVLLLLLPWIIGTYLSEVLFNVGLYILMGLGLNIAIGLAGLLDLGYVTNFAIGAYVMAVLTSTGPMGIGHVNFWLVLPISVLSAMFTGFILALPVLRMRGDYLAIATLGFGEIIRLLALSDWLSPLIGGAQGILFIPKPQIFGYVLDGPQQIYYLIVAACLLALFVSIRLNNSRTGRQWMALREDEDVAGAMGIDTMKAKLLAFTLSAATGGLAGAIFASKLGTIFPHSFSLLISINALSVIIVGGMGSIPGIVVGAFALIGLPEILREFAEFRLLLYGALLIIMMLVRPEGLWPSAVRRRELQEEPTSPIDSAATISAGD